jgi:hypothetical protein
MMGRRGKFLIVLVVVVVLGLAGVESNPGWTEKPRLRRSFYLRRGSSNVIDL